MKRIALLLAAVGLGSGCVVETNCDEGNVDLEWGFVSVSGVDFLSCNDYRLSAPIVDVDVYVDGVAWATYVPCTDYGLTLVDVPTGSRSVMVEGYDTDGYIVTRDWFTVGVDGCGTDYVYAAPGEGIVEFVPNSCELTTTYLTYELEDQTRTPYVISAIYPTSPGITTFTCASGVGFPVPYGNYALTAIEETNSTASLIYASKCTPTYANVLGYGTTSVGFSWTGTAACF